MQMIRSDMVAGAPILGRGMVVVVGAILVGSLVVACSSSTAAIDGAKLEQKLRDDFGAAGTAVTTVTCPRDRPARTGDTFSCQITLEAGGVVTYDVVLSDDQGHYTYAVGPGQVLDGTAAAGLLTTDIASSAPALADAKVDCPKTVLAPGGRARFDCQLVTAGSATTISVNAAPGQPLEWQYKV